MLKDKEISEDDVKKKEKIIQDYKNQANTKTGDIEGKIIDLEKKFSPYSSILAIHIWKHYD